MRRDCQFMRNWILPEYISDILPNEAARIEQLRRAILDLFASYGYELVFPPLVEYVESLLVQDDEALDLKTFKLVDELTGRQMGLRADITPQVARIDAHILNRQSVTRLCYTGSVVNTRPDGLLSSREPRQIGAEIYGCAGLAADVEIIELMCASLALAGIHSVRLDIGDIALFRAIADAAALTGEARQDAFLALQQKDLPALREIGSSMSPVLAQGLLVLAQCYGGVEVLQTAKAALPDLPAIQVALARLTALSEALALRGLSVRFDLAELRSSDYHTGLVFAAYAPGFTNAVARGGRYDNMGKRFGRARPATGFSLDLREVRSNVANTSRRAILAPAEADEGLLRVIHELRQAGEVVIVDLGVDPKEVGCDRSLVFRDAGWQVISL